VVKSCKDDDMIRFCRIMSDRMCRACGVELTDEEKRILVSGWVKSG